MASPSRRCFHELDIVTSARLAARSANSSGGGASEQNLLLLDVDLSHCSVRLFGLELIDVDAG